MRTLLYHRDVNWPKHVHRNLPFGKRVLYYTNHAKRASQDDRYGDMKLPAMVDMADCQVFEAECPEKGKVTKIAFRVPLGDGREVCMAAIPSTEKRGLIVKTVWINLEGDNHKTLRRERYVK